MPLQAKDSTLEEAEALVVEGRHEEAAALLRPWLERNPGSLHGWDLLSMAYFALRDWQPLEEVTRWTCQVAPDSPQAWSNWGMVLRKLKQPQKARDAQERALSLDPTYHRPRVELRKLDDVFPLQTPEPVLDDDDFDLGPYFDEAISEE